MEQEQEKEIYEITEQLVNIVEKTRPTETIQNPALKTAKRWKKAVLWTIFILFNVGVLVFTMVKDFSGSSEITSTALDLFRRHWWWLALAVAALLAWFMCRTFAYATMMRLFTGKVRLGLCMSVVTIGQFYDKVTPLGTGGQPFQIHRLQNKNLPKGAAITMPMVEYFIGRFVFCFISIAAIILNATKVFGENVVMNTGIYVLAILGVITSFAVPFLLTLSLISKKACAKITKWIVVTAKFFKLTKDPNALYEKIMTNLEANISCMKMLFKKKRLLMLCVLFSIGASLATCSVGYFVIKAFGYGTLHGWGWAEILILMYLITNSVLLVPTPGNSGAADLSFYFVFESAILGAGAIATLLWRVIVFYVPVLIGFIHIVLISRKRKNKKALMILQ